MRTPWAPLIVIAGGAAAGALLLRRAEVSTGASVSASAPKSSVAVAPPAGPVLLAPGFGGATALAALAVYALLLALTFWWPSRAPVLGGVWTSFSQAGALVFGGGHVVLPLLERTVVATGWVSTEAFLAGYGAAQAVPGPMFSVAAYLGALVPTGAPPLAGAITAVAAIFLPGFLLVVAVLPAWASLTARPRALQAIAGANAAVVGLLAAALYEPIWTAGVASVPDAVIAAIGLVILWSGRRSPLWVVAWCLVAAGGLALINIT
jgi:chromate transporter